MPSRGQSVTLEYTAWDTSANAPKAGDVANHTLRWIKDGTAGAPTNAAAEVDSVNAPGEYKVVLTGAECTCDFGKLAGKSSTANIVIIPVGIAFEQLPTAAPASNGGLPTADANNALKVQSGTGANQINLSGGNLAGPVPSVAGDVAGKVLGGGSGTIAGTGVQATVTGLITLDAGTIASATSTSFVATGLPGLAGQYTGRRLRATLAAGGTLVTDECQTHTVSGSNHTFTFGSAQNKTPATSDTVQVLGA